MKSRHAATPWWHGFAAVLVCIALGGCGGGGGGAEPTPPPPPASPNPDPGVAGAPYFPLNAGARWRYTQDGQPTTVRVLERTTVAGEQVVRLSTEEPTETTDEYLVVSASGVELLPGPNADAFLTAIGRYTRVRFPLRIGESQVLLNRNLSNVFDFDSDGRLDPLEVRLESTVVGFERIVGPHASFDNALRLRTTITQATTLSRDNRRIVVVSTAEEWYAPDIGLVRSVVSYNDGSPTERLDLREWSVGSQRSDNVAPAAQTLAPLAGALTRSAAISLTFSEAVEADSLAQPALEVRGPDGNTVPGNVSTTDSITLRFTPSQPLANGSYTVRLLGAPADWFGNTVAPVSWTFTLDASGPTLVSATPAAGAADVSTASAVVLEFDEPVNAATALANVAFSSSAGQVPFTLSVSGRTMTLTPGSPLQKAVRYEVFVGTGLTDSVGNPLPAPLRLGFTTDPGRFALPVQLPGIEAGSNVRYMNLSDLNGDGRSDLVLSRDRSVFFIDGGTQHVLLSTGIGTWQTRSALLPLSSCSGASTTGDFNGDGRTDIVTIGLICGIEWWTQDATGGWNYEGVIANGGGLGQPMAIPLTGSARPGLINTSTIRGVELRRPAPGGGFLAPESLYPSSSRMVMGDLNGDGRMDLAFVDTSGLNPTLVLLTQRADATFAAQTTTAVTLLGTVLAADVDGDGRTDLVSLGRSEATRLLLHLQRADGSLAPPVALAAPLSVLAVRVADMNGDGLADLVALHGHPLPNQASLTLFTRQPGGGWTASDALEWGIPVAFPVLQTFEVADFNGDGRLDLLLGDQLLLHRATASASGLRTGSGSVKRHFGGAGTANLFQSGATASPLRHTEGSAQAPVQSRSLSASQAGSMP